MTRDYDYSLVLDPFERRHIGEHGAFILRTNTALVKEACRQSAARKLAETTFHVSNAVTFFQRGNRGIERIAA